ncbi:replication-relaxation family protein [Kibdelosporangium aridum]|uniref:Replication-relaxation n=1 Tax=Kibdelosporangium aridum TaxID=2030 RepID=A0A1Y5YCT7_KIBAR|nr:replication-relaxation family protein [Kibdelosporangium aridum]SMD27439.1 Replication-relaxation [Kibdelosporangium aridum]
MITNPTPQRTLRGHRTTQPTRRAANTADHRLWLAHHLTGRDRWLIRMLFEHKVLTSHQIIDLAFHTRRVANQRLRLLYLWGIVHRFQPYLTVGSAPMHYVLDSTGATILAEEEGIKPSTLNYNRDRAAGRAQSLQLAHDVGCNSLFTTLVRRGRQPGATGHLTTWWSAARCRRLWGDIVTPDGYGRWTDTNGDVEWFIEFDFGTEQLSRLTDKLHRYTRLATSTGVTTPVLMWFPTPTREAAARTAIEGLNVPVATTNATAASNALDMGEPRWLGLGNAQSRGRVTLVDLPTLWPDIPVLETGTNNLAASSSDLAAPHPMPPPTVEYERARS